MSNDHAVAAAIIRLMQGVLYRESDEDTWITLERLGGGVRDHFATIGSYAFVAGMGRVVQDVPPFMLCEGQPARPRCVNVVALKRNNFPEDVRNALSEAHRLIYRARVGLEHAREILRADSNLVPQVQHLFEFIEHQQCGKFGRARQARRAA